MEIKREEEAVCGGGNFRQTAQGRPTEVRACAKKTSRGNELDRGRCSSPGMLDGCPLQS